MSLAAGERSVKLSASPAEFAPVFSAFEQMAGDLSSSRDALETAQRRTEAVLQHVASGVLAVHPDGAVIIANPRVESMLGMTSCGSSGCAVCKVITTARTLCARACVSGVW